MQEETKRPDADRGQLLLRYYARLSGRYGPQGWWPARTRLEIILGAILTQNTTWHNATLALRNLRKSGFLSWQGLRRASLSSLETCVRPSGFYRQKARTLRDFVDWLSQEHAASLDRLFSLPDAELRLQLLNLRGLGPETADAIILYAAQRPVFVADAYTRRVLARHGFVTEAADYHATQEFLHEHLPQDASLYNEYHALLVELGKKHCKRQAPQCAGCPLEEFLSGAGSSRSLTQVEEPVGPDFRQQLQPA